MTAEEFKKSYNNRYASRYYKEDIHSILNDYVIDGIYQCLVNQEKIMKMLNK